MTEERKPRDDRSATEEGAGGSAVFEELNVLGRELASAFKALWEHEDSRRMRQELQEGFIELGRQIDSAVHSAQESDPARQFSDQVKEVVDKARESDVSSKLEEGLVTGLQELNAQVSQWVSSLQPSETDHEEPETESEPEAETEA